MEAHFPLPPSAVEDAEIAFISRRDFQAYCMEHPEVALKVLQVVGARLRRLVGIIEELSFTTIRQRLISALLKLADSEGKKTVRGIEFQLPGTHQELANQLGTVRELVSRNLMRLQAEGLLDVDARQIVVKDVGGLKSLLGHHFLETTRLRIFRAPSDISYCSAFLRRSIRLPVGGE